MEKFEYMPRITILPNEHLQARIDTLALCAVKYKYDNIMFFINAENLNDGHIALADLPKYIECIKQAKVKLSEHNIKTSLNPWNTLLGCDRGRQLQEGQDFRLMVDVDGKSATATACPTSEKWREYFAQYYTYLVKEIEPDTIWIEDDFRLHNHAPLNWGGCFCDEHMKLYSSKLGYTVTREEFVKGVLSNDENNLMRKAWLDVSRETMTNLAQYIGAKIESVNPNTKVGLMTSDPKVHCIECRDWEHLLGGLAQSKRPIDRIHLPSYRQDTAQNYGWSYNDISMMTRALIPEETSVLPEVENAFFSTYTKSKNFTRFQVESTIPLIPSGVTLDLDCFAGNGIVADYGYGESLAKIKPYLSSVLSLDLQFSSMRGIIIPISEFSSSYVVTPCGENMNELAPNENWWASQLSQWGVCYQYSLKTEFFSQLIAISGDYLRGLSDEKIINLFKNNFVFLDGFVVASLFDRGLEYLICASSYVALDSEDGGYSFEEAESGKRYLSLDGCRTSCLVTCPNYCKIEYTKEVERYSNIFDHKQRMVGSGCVSINNSCFVLPYFCKGKQFGLLSTMREQIFKEVLQEFGANYTNNPIYSFDPYLSKYFYENEKFDTLMLVNFSDEVFENVELIGLKEYQSYYYIDRANGEMKLLEYTKTPNGIKLTNDIDAMVTMTIIMNKL